MVINDDEVKIVFVDVYWGFIIGEVRSKVKEEYLGYVIVFIGLVGERFSFILIIEIDER